jgi:3-oxoacyl-[acyl-carrier-protein] synthase II
MGRSTYHQLEQVILNDLDFVPKQARTHRVKAALSNSFGFGGHNVTLALKAVT